MSRLFYRTSSLIVDCPRWTLSLLVFISALAIVGYVAPETIRSRFIAAARDTTDSIQDDTYETPPDVDPVSLTDADAVILVESDSFFTPMGAEAMRLVVKELEELDQVRHVLWMDRVPIMNIFGLVEPLLPPATASQGRFDAAKAKALAHPLVAGQLLSSAGNHLVLLINFEFLFIESNDDCTRVLNRVAESAAAKFPDVDLDFKITGRIPMFITAIETRDANIVKYQTIGYCMIVLMAVILFRGVNAVLVVAIAPSLGVFWTMGILRFFDWQDNPFNDTVVPVLLSLSG